MQQLDKATGCNGTALILAALCGLISYALYIGFLNESRCFNYLFHHNNNLFGRNRSLAYPARLYAVFSEFPMAVAELPSGPASVLAVIPGGFPWRSPPRRVCRMQVCGDFFNVSHSITQRVKPLG
jgi:hypothetical protein